MSKITDVNPLITNFIIPQMPEVVSPNEIKMIYDPQSQITLFMGGKSSPTRSYDGYKKTKEKSEACSGYIERNDAERWTDD